MRRSKQRRGFGSVESCVQEEVQRESGSICEFLFELSRKAGQISKTPGLHPDERGDWKRLADRISKVYFDECLGAPQR